MNQGAATRFAARLTLAVMLGAGTTVKAQDCHPSKGSNEANLLAFYSVPIAFSTQRTPVPDASARIGVGLDLAYVPKPDPDLRITTECFLPKDHTTHLTSVFPRPRIAARLPGGYLLEVSYLPPIRIANATAHVFSAAIGGTAMIFPAWSNQLTVAARLHGTIGTIRGAITCSRAALRPNDPGDPCFGTEPSEDTFHPNMLAAEAMLVRHFANRGELYLGGGTTWLRPRFQVGFRDGFGGLEDTRLLVNLNRTNVFGGGALRIADRWLVTGQIYSAPADVTLARLGVAWEGWTGGREER